MISIIEIATRFRKVVTDGELEDVLPLFSYYPSNCCEHSSVLFGYYLSLLLPNLQIEIIRGTDTQSYHFWLEIDGLVYDLTLDQFDEFDLPIYAEHKHPFRATYVEDKRILLENYIPYYLDKCLDSKSLKKALLLIIKNVSLIDAQTENHVD